MTVVNQQPGGFGTYLPMGGRFGPLPTGSAQRIGAIANCGYGLPANSIYQYNIAPNSGSSEDVAESQDVNSGGQWITLRPPNVFNASYCAFPYLQNEYKVYGLNSLDVQTPIQGDMTTAIQFDLPRVLQFTPSGGVLDTTDITIFGFDWYLQPMQEKQTFGFTGDRQESRKAFYGITGIYSESASSGNTIEIASYPEFGLPYVLNDLYASVLGAAGGSTDVGFHTSDYTIRAASTSNSLSGGDIRGTITLSNTPPGTISLTYYVGGASPDQAFIQSRIHNGNPGNINFTAGSATDYGADSTYGPAPLYYGYVV